MPAAETQRTAGEAIDAQPDDATRQKARAAALQGGERGAPNIAAHPRAARRVAESKAWGGLAGFAFGGYLSLAHHTVADAAFRGLLSGVACYVAVWAAAVFLWRRLVVAELNQAEHVLIDGELQRRGAQVAHAPADHRSDIQRADRESVRD